MNVLDVACPYCRAAIGEQCVVPSGEPRAFGAHSIRFAAAWKRPAFVETPGPQSGLTDGESEL